MRQLFFAFIAFFSFNILSAQVTEKDSTFSTSDFAALEQLEDTLGVLAYAVINDSLPENRFASCQKLIPTLVKALKTKNSFQYPFEQLKSISIQYPQDSSFRIFTWQLFVDNDQYQYFGTIQMNTPDLKLYPLIDRSSELSELDLEYEILDNENWYGSVYYKLKDFDTPEGKKYLLFGFDGYSFFNKRKIIDVLSFKDGKPSFGAPVFAKMEEDRAPITKNRVALTYSAETSIRLNYDEHMGIVIFDHLIASKTPLKGQGPTYVPDGSYQGYKLENDLWVLVDKLFNEVSEEAPREVPILDNRKGKNIFGKPN